MARPGDLNAGGDLVTLAAMLVMLTAEISYLIILYDGRMPTNDIHQGSLLLILISDVKSLSFA